jgi:hypothetical protein
MKRQGSRALLLALVLALTGQGCDFQKDPDAGPAAVLPIRFVTIRVEYRQPAGCQNTDLARCGDRVWFFGSWMKAPTPGTSQGEEVALDTRFGPNFWEGFIPNVPVNWPPQDFPHFVRVFDPHLQSTPSGGVTAARLIIGGQIITEYDQPGTTQESGIIYVDDNGVGRSPS